MNSPSRFLVFGFVTALAVAVYFIGIRPRLNASTAVEERAHASEHPSINVVVAQHAPNATEFLLPANLQALQEAPIFARTDGYLSRFLVDLGDSVKAGQPLAVIEGPEVDLALNQARAALEQAQANLALARTSAVRWRELAREKAVAQQELDEKTAALAAREADVHAAEANVSRLTQLEQYQTILAPFDGVISARNVDVGALISAGTAGRELFRLAQTGTLRVYVSVPQSYFRSVRTGLAVDLLVNEFPGRTFAGKVVRVAGALDRTTRTLTTEVQIPNDHGELLAGMFGQVRFRIHPEAPALLVPSNAVVLHSDGTFVATVDDQKKVRFAKVQLGRDFGTQIEILAGLAEGSLVVANPSDALTDGLLVDPLLPATAQKS